MQYIHHLRSYAATIEALVFSTLDVATSPEEARALTLVKSVWEGALEVAGA